MGGKSSKHHPRSQGAGNGHSAPQTATKKGTTLARSRSAQPVGYFIFPASLNAEAPTPLESVPQGVFDVAISATREDGALAEFIKGEILVGPGDCGGQACGWNVWEGIVVSMT